MIGKPQQADNFPNRRYIWRTGLQNLGNTCYMNAAIQCLSKVKPIKKYFRHEKIDIQNSANDGYNYELLAKFQELIINLWQGYQVITPNEFINQAYSLCPDYRPKTQQDSQEFLRFLLDNLNSTLNHIFGSSIISNTFIGTIECKTICKSCHNISDRDESFLDLSLAIPSEICPESYKMMDWKDQSLLEESKSSWVNQVKGYLWKGGGNVISLYDCLIQHFKPEMLNQEDNLYYCSHCESKKEAVQEHKIKILPQTLIINLKRFKYAYWGSKVSTYVQIPFNLNLSRFSCDEGHNEYQLISIMQHYGAIWKGHYTAYCKNTKTNKWYLYDDIRVREVQESEVANAQVYIAFYEKIERI